MRTPFALGCLLLACSPVTGGTTEAPSGTTGDMSSSTGAEEPTGEGTTTSTGEPPATTTGTTGAPAGPCGQPPPFTGAMSQTIEVAGKQRKYILAIPADYDPDTTYPLVFAWHGRGTTNELARLYFKVEEASQGQAIFVYPQGLPLADMDGQTGWDAAPDGEDVALFDAILADAGARLCLDEARIFSTGHSFGAFMSNVLGCARGDVVRAIAPVAGLGPYSSCTGQVAAWITHGMSDDTVPFAEGEASRDRWAAANHCEVTADPADPAPCTAHSGCDSGFPVHWCPHDESGLGGHGWPDWAGPAIWAFFAAL